MRERERERERVLHSSTAAFHRLSFNQSIIVFCPRAGFSLQTQHSPLYPLLSLPFRIFIQSIYHNVVYHLITSSPRTFFPLTIPSRAPLRKSRHWGGNASVPPPLLWRNEPSYLFSGKLRTSSLHCKRLFVYAVCCPRAVSASLCSVHVILT